MALEPIRSAVVLGAVDVEHEDARDRAGGHTNQQPRMGTPKGSNRACVTAGIEKTARASRSLVAAQGKTGKPHSARANAFVNVLVVDVMASPRNAPRLSQRPPRLQGTADELRHMRANAGRDGEQRATTVAAAKNAVWLIADEAFIHLQRTTAWSPRSIASCRAEVGDLRRCAGCSIGSGSCNPRSTTSASLWISRPADASVRLRAWAGLRPPRPVDPTRACGSAVRFGGEYVGRHDRTSSVSLRSSRSASERLPNAQPKDR